MRFLEIENVLDYGFDSKITSKMINIGAASFASNYSLKPNDVPWVGATMAPTDSFYDNYIEHPHNAINYFIERNVHHVAVQIKEMGSRAMILFDKNKDLLQVYSRGLKQILLNDDEKNDLKKDLELFLKMYNLDGIILDTEMLPWIKLAKDMVEREFIIPGLMYKYDNPECEFVHKYFKSLSNYTKDGDTNFKIFDIVATKKDGHWNKTHNYHDFGKNDSIFGTTINKVSSIFCDLRDETSKGFITDYWKHVTSHGVEGIVIKPVLKSTETVPYLKVRGKEYLRLIYGIDYDRNIKSYNRRNLKKKRMQSIAENIVANRILDAWIDCQNGGDEEVHLQWLFGFIGLKNSNSAFIDATL